jgi:hypothetical protein
MWRSLASNALTLFVVVLALVAGILTWGREQFTGPGLLSTRAALTRLGLGRRCRARFRGTRRGHECWLMTDGSAI